MSTAERRTEVVADVLAALHEVLERHQVTEEEWTAALAFLTEVGRADEFILLSDVTRTSVLIDALSHGDDDGATASDVEGPLYVDDPPWREVAGEDLRGLRGDGRRRRAVRPRHRHLDRRQAAARRGRRRLADRPERRLRHLGRAPAGVQLPRPLEAADDGGATSSRRCSRSPTRCRPTGRSGATWRRSASTRGGPRTSTSR